MKLTVPLHNEMKKGTLSRIIKDAQLSLENFENFKYPHSCLSASTGFTFKAL